MPFTAAEMAKHLQGEVIGDGAVVLKGFAPANNAREGDLTFAENEAYLARAEQSAAAAVLVDGQFNSAKKVLIRVGNARIAFAKALTLFFPEPSFPPGIHATACVIIGWTRKIKINRKDLTRSKPASAKKRNNRKAARIW